MTSDQAPTDLFRCFVSGAKFGMVVAVVVVLIHHLKGM